MDPRLHSQKTKPISNKRNGSLKSTVLVHRALVLWRFVFSTPEALKVRGKLFAVGFSSEIVVGAEADLQMKALRQTLMESLQSRAVLAQIFDNGVRVILRRLHKLIVHRAHLQLKLLFYTLGSSAALVHVPA